MGQYFHQVIGDAEGNLLYSFDLALKNRESIRILAKLMEHSWIDNLYSNSIAAMFHNQKLRLAWIGDYADKPKFYQPLHEHSSALIFPEYDWAWGENCKYQSVIPSNFSLQNKFIINHDRKEYLNCNNYINESISFLNDNPVVIHPLPLLTAIGNGEGSGDFCTYASEGIEFVGIWSWDLLEISSEKPDNYSEVLYKFIMIYR